MQLTSPLPPHLLLTVYHITFLTLHASQSALIESSLQLQVQVKQRERPHCCPS